MNQSGQRLQHGIEGTDVAPEESTDDLGALRAATTLEHHGREPASRHLAKERQDRFWGRLGAQAGRARHAVGIAVWDDEDVASLEVYGRAAAKGRPARALRHDVI